MTDPAPPQILEEGSAPEQRSIGDVPWGVGDAILVLVIWVAAIVFLGAFLLTGLERAFPDVAADAFTLPVTAGLLILCTTLYVHTRYRGVRLLFGPRRPGPAALLTGIGAGVVALIVFAIGLGNLLQWVADAMQSELPQVQEEFRELANEETAVPLLIFGAVVLGPIAEELFYRGMLYAGLRRRLPLWPAMGLSGVLFGISHLQNTLEGYLLVLIIIVPLGMFFAWIYERTGTLLVPVVAHAVFNLVQVLYMVQTGGQV